MKKNVWRLIQLTITNDQMYVQRKIQIDLLKTYKTYIVHQN